MNQHNINIIKMLKIILVSLLVLVSSSIYEKCFEKCDIDLEICEERQIMTYIEGKCYEKYYNCKDLCRNFEKHSINITEAYEACVLRAELIAIIRCDEPKTIEKLNILTQEFISYFDC